jgi:ABC-type glycerol-3-phosphate transport system permease component
MITMIIPHQTLQHSMYLEFRNFDILGIVRLLKGGGIQIFNWNGKELGEGVAEFFGKLDILPKEIVIGVDEYGDDIVMQFKQTGVNIAKTYLPLILLSATGLAFKNGLYIFLLRQFFRGIPDELEESAYMDGCGTFRTFVQIILPLSIPMMVTVFLFAFCWQWTDDFYVGKIIETTASNTLLVDLVGKVPPSLKLGYAGQTLYETAIRNTCGLMIIAPLVILYAFCQNFLVQGIEHSGIAN